MRKPYKLSEDENSFTVNHEDGTPPFKVAKRDLDKGTMERIRNFAKGGEVHMERMKEMKRMPEMKRVGPERHFAEGGYNPAETFKENVGMVGQMLDPREALKGTSLNDPLRGPENVISGEDFAKKKAAGEYYEAEPGVYHRKGDVVSKFGEAPSTPTGNQAAQPDMSQEAPPPAPEPEEKVQPLRVGALGGHGFDTDIKSDLKTEREGVQNWATADTAQHAEGYAAIRSLQKQQADTTTKWELKRQSNEADAAKMREDIKNTNIDPANLWHSMAGWQKASASLALMLGGIGQGLGAGQNAAMTMLDKAIENDISAQRSNLGKKQTQLEDLVRQGHTINEAEQMERARLKDVARTALELSGERFGGDKAKAKALEASGALGMKATAERSSVATQAAQRLNAATETAIRAKTFELEQQKMLDAKKMVKDLQSRGMDSTSAFETTQIVQGGKVGDHLVAAPQITEVRDEHGNTQRGIKYVNVLTHTPEDKKEWQKDVAPAVDLYHTFARIEELQHQYGATMKAHPEVMREMKQLSMAATLAYPKASLGLPRLTGTEYTAVHNVIKDPSSIVGAFTGSNEATTRAFMKELVDHIDTHKKMLLVGGGRGQ